MSAHHTPDHAPTNDSLPGAEALLEQKSLELFDRKLQESRLAEQALRESEQRYQLLVEQSPEAILIEVDGRFVYANPAAVRLFGAREAEPRIEFVDVAVGRHTPIRLREAGPVEQPRLAAVAGPGVNLH